MRDLPISFSAPMVRALLAGTKTQTRRLINLKPDFPIVDFVKVAIDKNTGRSIYEMKDRYGNHVTLPAGKHLRTPHYSPPIAVGDRLYVREHWRTLQKLDDLSPRHLADDRFKITYEADPENRNPLWAFGRHRQAMHMPRWASRITLFVDDVKVERLQDISEEDAEAEGIVMENVIVGATCAGGSHREINGDRFFFDGGDDEGYESAADAYAALWDRVNGEGAWDRNDWVVAYTFRVVLESIDYIGRAA